GSNTNPGGLGLNRTLIDSVEDDNLFYRLSSVYGKFCFGIQLNGRSSNRSFETSHSFHSISSLPIQSLHRKWSINKNKVGIEVTRMVAKFNSPVRINFLKI